MTSSAPTPSMVDRAACWLFGAGSHLAPGAASERAARTWYSIPSRVMRTTAATPAPGGTAFEAISEGRVVRGYVWGEGPVVYLVHGWGADSQQMAPLVAPILRSGCRVVAFDGPGHGCSDPGALGPGRSHAAEFGKALDSVAAVHGPARAVVAHSLGAMATMLTLRFGWTSVERLVFLAPMAELRSHLDQFGQQLRLSNRARRVSMPLSRPRSGWPSRSSTSPTCWTRPRGLRCWSSTTGTILEHRGRPAAGWSNDGRAPSC